jgi:hypothetical protein
MDVVLQETGRSSGVLRVQWQGFVVSKRCSESSVDDWGVFAEMKGPEVRVRPGKGEGYVPVALS